MKKFSMRLVSTWAIVNFALALSAAYAADFTITVTADCTLADAITAANDDTEIGGCPAGDGTDVIALSENITLGSALPLITSEITINGAGYRISGANRHHIFGVSSRGNLTINDLTLRDGKAGWGAAIGNLQGNVIINNSTLAHNSADQGGAIGNEGTITIIGSVVRNNSSTEEGGAIYNLGGTVNIVESVFVLNSSESSGGAIFSEEGTIQITSSRVSDNSARNGGAIKNDEGTVIIDGSTFLGNKSVGPYSDGGAIYNYISVSNDEDEVTIANSTFQYNESEKDGGAIYTFSGLTVSSSTFLSNRAGENGGGIYENSYTTISIQYSTFVGNAAGENGGGIYLDTDGQVDIDSTIIAGSSGGGDCWGRPNHVRLNLIEDGSCFAEIMGDPMLADFVDPLEDSPGYFPLRAGSTAIDAVACDDGIKSDQIGTPRPQGEACDIGAIEYVPEAGDDSA